MQLMMFRDEETNEMVAHTLSPEVEKVMDDYDDRVAEERDGWLTEYPNVLVRTIAVAYERDGKRGIKQVHAPLDIFEGEKENSTADILKGVIGGLGDVSEKEVTGIWDVTKSYIKNRILGNDFSINLEPVIKEVKSHGLITKENQEEMEIIKRCFGPYVIVKVGVASIDGDEVLEFLLEQPLECTILGFSSCFYVYEHAIKDEVVKAIESLNKQVNFITMTFY